MPMPDLTPERMKVVEEWAKSLRESQDNAIHVLWQIRCMSEEFVFLFPEHFENEPGKEALELNERLRKGLKDVQSILFMMSDRIQSSNREYLENVEPEDVP